MATNTTVSQAPNVAYCRTVGPMESVSTVKAFTVDTPGRGWDAGSVGVTFAAAW